MRKKKREYQEQNELYELLKKEYIKVEKETKDELKKIQDYDISYNQDHLNVLLNEFNYASAEKGKRDARETQLKTISDTASADSSGATQKEKDTKLAHYNDIKNRATDPYQNDVTRISKLRQD